MDRKKIIISATTLIIIAIAFVGYGKYNNYYFLNKEKTKVEDSNNLDKKSEDGEAKTEDDEAKIKDDEAKKAGETDTDLGKGDSSENKEAPLKKYDAVAKIEPLMFGANVTVTCDNPEIATFEIHSEVNGTMEPIQEQKVAIGEPTLVFPAKEGQSVLIKFFDANGTLLGESETTLVQ